MVLNTFEKVDGLTPQEQSVVASIVETLKTNRQLEVEFGEMPKSLDALFMLLNIALTIQDSLEDVPEGAEFFFLKKITFAKRLATGTMSYTWKVAIELETAVKTTTSRILSGEERKLTTLLKSVREHPDNQAAKEHLIAEMHNLELMQELAAKNLIPGLLTYSVARPEIKSAIPDTPTATFCLTEFVEGRNLKELQTYDEVKQAYLQYAKKIDLIASEAGVLHTDIKALNAIFNTDSTPVDWSGVFIFGSDSTPDHPVLKQNRFIAESFIPVSVSNHIGNFVPLTWDANSAYQFAKRSMLFATFRSIFGSSLGTIAANLVPRAGRSDKDLEKEVDRVLSLLSTPDHLCRPPELKEKSEFEVHFSRILVRFLKKNKGKPLSDSRAIELADLVITELKSEQFTDSMSSMVNRIFGIIDN